jgi:hypothetical protein
MSLLFALVVSVCAAVIGALFVRMWLDEDIVASTALAAALLSTLVLALLAWEKTL